MVARQEIARDEKKIIIQSNEHKSELYIVENNGLPVIIYIYIYIYIYNYIFSFIHTFFLRLC